MKNACFTKLLQQVQNLVKFTPFAESDRFVLDEIRPEDSREPDIEMPEPSQISWNFLEELIRYGDRVRLYQEKFIKILNDGRIAETLPILQKEFAILQSQWKDLSLISYSYKKSQEIHKQIINASIEENRRTINTLYNLPKNKDIVVRDIEIKGTPSAKAMVVYLDGMVASEKLNLAVLQPLMLFTDNGSIYDSDSVEVAMKKMIPNGQVRKVTIFSEVEDGVNCGDAALIIDGFEEAIIIETKGWEHRSVQTPQTEQTIRGSQAAFSENLRVNTGLIRSILRTSDLVTEIIPVGSRGRLNCAILYIESIANPILVKEVKRRLSNICTDYIPETGSLAQFIQDEPNSIFPLTLSTERPDRTAVGLTEGRVVILMDGTPFALILPVNFFSFFHSAEDFSVAPVIANFMRSIRFFGALISVTLPALYIAITYFHQEAIPTELLLAIAGSRENVPFPGIVEVLMMEISFELIREAGVRIPGLLGATIGIVGAIILGQAAVLAHIVSPIIVVIIAITGLASFAIPEYRMSHALRISRFVLLFFAWSMGLIGVATAIVGYLVILCRLKSFGVPYMAPLAPRTNSGLDVIIRGPVFSQEHRPDELNPLDRTRQSKISRIWVREPSEGEEKE